MSNLLKQKHALTSLRAKLEEKKERECWSCKGFRHLAQNCRNKERKEKRGTTPQNKFEVLSSRVMQCDVKERMIRKQKTVKVECFKYGHAIKGTAKRVEEEFSTRPMTKSTGAMWRGYSR